MVLLLLLLVTVQALVLRVELTGIGQFLGFGLGINMAISTSLLGRLGILWLAERNRRANQESTQQNGSGQNHFQMGHRTSRIKSSNCIATRLPPAFQWVCKDFPNPE